MIKPFFEDTVVLFVKMLSVSVAECAVILVGFVIIGRKLKAKSDSMNSDSYACSSRSKLKSPVI